MIFFLCRIILIKCTRIRPVSDYQDTVAFDTLQNITFHFCTGIQPCKSIRHLFCRKSPNRDIPFFCFARPDHEWPPDPAYLQGQ